jgi:DNA-binding response OmpR family regulator
VVILASWMRNRNSRLDSFPRRINRSKIFGMPKILYVEDDSDTAQAVIDLLTAKRFVIEHEIDGNAAWERLCLYQYDLLILDWILPGMTGIEILRRFRQRGGLTPALMLTGNSAIADKESGFSVGTDDYLTKPFDIRELALRVDALLSRPRERLEPVLRVGSISLDSNSFTVTRADEEIKLMPKEFALLQFFLRHPNVVFSADTILERVWHSDADVTTDTVVTTLKRLRKRIDVEGQTSVIQTVFGVGYKLVPPAE